MRKHSILKDLGDEALEDARWVLEQRPMSWNGIRQWARIRKEQRARSKLVTA